jgi:hypothetical protein
MTDTPLNAASRRKLLKSAAALAAVSGVGGLPAIAQAAATAKTIAGHRPQLVPSAQTLAGWLKALHDFGPIRATGTPQCRAFEEYLAAEFAKLGCTIERDRYRLSSWECTLATDCEITVQEDGGKTRKLEVVSYYPFCGTTRGKGPVSGRVLYAGVGAPSAQAILASTDPAVLKESIVVIDMPIGFAGTDRIKLYPGGTFGADDPLLRTGAPSASGAGGAGLMKALQDHCKGFVLCYTDVSNDAARHNWLPFSEPHGTVPALWVGAESSPYLKSVSGKASLTMRCDAKVTPDARADTIVATLKGQTDEAVMLTTQTDGPNECNENGGLGVLAVATYLAKLPLAERRRTFVFSLPTGHYAFGAVADPVTGTGRRGGTFGVIEKRPELMKRVVAQVAMEQMGAMEWSDIDGRYVATGRVAPEFWLPTNNMAATRPAGVATSPNSAATVGGTVETAAAARRMFAAATVGENPKFSRAGVVESGFAPGEGGSLRSRGIPGIGLMGAPSFFFRADPKGVLEKLSPEVMHNQVSIFTKMVTLMDRLSVAQLRGEAPIGDTDLFGA